MEMQATLAEVELSAFNGTHVFGSAHSAALDELREAQIALAEAWGREEGGEGDGDDGDGLGGEASPGKGKEDAARKDAESEEDEGDIAEARRRREANERYFRRVGEDVGDVVGKLEGVAQAMAKVERESREIWNGSESVDSGSIAATGS